MLNYEGVPSDILTSKDLDYLSDIFQWNYVALKKTDNDCDMIDDEEIVAVFEKAVGLFDDNLNSVLNILESRGDASE